MGGWVGGWVGVCVWGLCPNVDPYSGYIGIVEKWKLLFRV